MPRDITLLSYEELLTQEANLKNLLSEADKGQQKVPHSSFIARRHQLDAQLEGVLAELGRRESP